MNPVVPRVGGKFYSRKEVISFFPKKIEDYAEAFMGGGSIFFNLLEEGVAIKNNSFVNDLNDYIFNTWYCFRDEDLYVRLMKKILNENIHSQKIFFYLRDTKFSDPADIAFAHLMLSRMSFGAKGETYYNGFADIGHKRDRIYKKEDFWKNYHKYLVKMNTKVSNMDFEKFIKGVDKKQTFLYCDPPYYETPGYGELNFKKNQHEKLLELLTNFKGKWALSYNPHEWVLKNYKEFNINYIDTQYSLYAHSTKNKKGVQDVLITNYINPQKDLTEFIEVEKQ